MALGPGGRLRVLRNQGGGSFAESTGADGPGETRELCGFVEVTAALGLQGLAAMTSAGWVDADGDRRPDLHLLGATGHRVFANRAGGVFRASSTWGLSPGSSPLRPGLMC